MGRIILIIVALLLVVLVTMACTFQVEESEYAIVTRFGNPVREIKEAGLHFKLPPPMDAVVTLDRRLNVLDPDPGAYLTSDKKNVLVSCYLTWSVEEPTKYLVSVTGRVGAEGYLTDIMRSEVGTILGSYPLSVLVSSGDEERESDMARVMGEVTERASNKALENFGIRVSAVRIKRLSFPTQNKRAVFRRMEAERQRIARLYRSEGEEEAEKIQAQANREQSRLINEAKRAAAEIRGEGDAEAIRILNEAHSRDPEFYEFLRSLEALANTVRENSTFVVPSDWKLLEFLKDPDLLRLPGARPESPKEARED